MRITFDPAKHVATLATRGLDFADAEQVFADVHATAPDERHDYGERRFVSAGFLRGRLVGLVWTPRGDGRRIISMRYGHAEEAARWEAAIGRSR